MDDLSDIQHICLQTFDSVSHTVSIFIVPLFLARVIAANTIGEGHEALKALKALVTYFLLTAAFPIILEILFSIPEAYLPKLSSLTNLDTAPDLSNSSIIPFALDRIIEVILAALYWVTYYLHILFMIMLCSMAPIVFLTGTMLGVGLGIEIFMGLLIIGSTWPIIWFGFDQVHNALAQARPDAFGGKCLEILITLLKGLAPVAFASLAVKSPAGQAISKSIRASGAAMRSVGFPLMTSAGKHAYGVYQKYSTPLTPTERFMKQQRALASKFHSTLSKLDQARNRKSEGKES